MTRDLFQSYVEQALKFLPSESIIVLDNASCHTKLQLDSVLSDTGSVLKYLPPYSPELNPIEKLWGVIKQRLKKTYRYLTEDFFEAISLSLRAHTDELSVASS